MAKTDEATVSQTAPEVNVTEKVNDPTKTQSNDSFSSMLSRISPEQTSQILINTTDNSEPFFTLDDLKAVDHPLAKILRKIFINENITVEKYKQLYTEAANKTCMDSNSRNYGRNNLKRSIQLPHTTWDTLDKCLMIAGLELVELSLTYRVAKTGEVKEVKLSDIQKLIREQPYQSKTPMIRVNSVFNDLIAQNHKYDQ